MDGLDGGEVPDRSYQALIDCYAEPNRVAFSESCGLLPELVHVVFATERCIGAVWMVSLALVRTAYTSIPHDERCHG